MTTYFSHLYIAPRYCEIVDTNCRGLRKNCIFQGTYEEFEDTKGVIRIRISKDRQHNDHKKKNKRTNSDKQSIYIKIKTE